MEQRHGLFGSNDHTGAGFFQNACHRTAWVYRGYDGATSSHKRCSSRREDNVGDGALLGDETEVRCSQHLKQLLPLLDGEKLHIRKTQRGGSRFHVSSHGAVSGKKVVDLRPILRQLRRAKNHPESLLDAHVARIDNNKLALQSVCPTEALAPGSAFESQQGRVRARRKESDLARRDRLFQYSPPHAVG